MDQSGPPNLLLLARGAVHGSPEALEQLLLVLYPVVRRYLTRLFGDELDLASDITQEVMVRVARGLPRARAETNEQLLAWSLTIARNLSTDWLRTLRWEPSFRGSSIPSDPALPSGSSESVPSPAFATLLQLVRAAEETLPPATREIMYLHVAQDASWTEAGAAVGIPATAAKRRFQRAQGRLQKEVSRQVAKLQPALQARVLDLLRRWGV